MKPIRYTDSQIKGIERYFNMDKRMSVLQWVHLAFMKVFNRSRYERFYHCVKDGLSIEKSFELSKIKEHEIIF